MSAIKVLYDFRTKKGLSTREIAEKLGVSDSFYLKIEQGQRQPSRNFLMSFKRAFPSFDMNIFFDEKRFK